MEGEAFLEYMRDSYLIQHVNTVTWSRDSYLIQQVNTVTWNRENGEPSMSHLILTNEEEMIDNLHVKDPLGYNDHCFIEFQFKCYIEPYNISKERWNYFKGNYEQMNKKLDLNWDKN